MSAYNDLAGVVTFRPLSMRLPAPTYQGWSGSPFRASWTDTVDKLVAEVRHLKARQTILEPGDGWPMLHDGFAAVIEKLRRTA